MAQLQTKYITPDEFKAYSGIDLAMITDDANPSNKQAAFLKRIEDRMATLIDVNCFRKVDVEYPNFSEYQKEHYKRALMEQAIYVFRNGELSEESGYDFEKGVIANAQSIHQIALSPNAKDELILCGLWSRKIRMSDWATSGLWGF